MSEENDDLIVSVQKREPVRVQFEPGKDPEELEIVEMLGDEHEAFLTWNNSRIKFDKNGKAVGAGDMKDHMAKLISMCLRDKDGRLVKIDRVRKLTTSAQEKLAKKCMVMHGFTPPEKKGSSDQERTAD